ncbi:hypothetical protein B0H67DRAFT_484682 [Lasiosphaeris hirsuta]|uniref:SET domain-containing protein n=1 Tax=Lasiosphaeris hirsuta TaxID=260670 RepID=A0AA40E212_9PEZI|nr:hypothetical protein B0H67DRAFT_484682 [Lasiosphaeris hirsuta]
MSRPELPIEELPIWAHLNGVKLTNVKIAKTQGRGYGVISENTLTSESTLEPPAWIAVPHNLVLNAVAVNEYAKEDRNFKLLLEAAEHRVTIASHPSHASIGVSNPWTEYLQLLPGTLFVPTLWHEDERLLLRGTSLEAAVNAKVIALVAEFDAIQQISSDIPCWNEVLWESGSVSLRDWLLLDALYRSRCLELPRLGESMVPCIDMVNHSASPTAYYDETSKDEVVLLPRPGASIIAGEEVTISYGDTKSGAEMLFSYGFIDPTSTAESLTLVLEPFPDDPLARAKLMAFGEAPKLHVARDGSSVVWKSPFAYLMCLNEEDGLDFRVLQDTEGGQQLRVFWQDDDVTDRVNGFEALIQSHPLSALFRLRVVTVIQERLEVQLDRARSHQVAKQDPDLGDVRDECLKAAELLRKVETGILESGIESLEEERSSLLADKNVVAYLGSMETAASDLVEEEASNEVEDFS